jgi:hypothetical protein
VRCGYNNAFVARGDGGDGGGRILIDVPDVDRL